MCSSVISSLTPHLISTTCVWAVFNDFPLQWPGTRAHASPCSTPWSWGRRTPSSSSSPSTCQWMWSSWRSSQPVKPRKFFSLCFFLWLSLVLKQWSHSRFKIVPCLENKFYWSAQNQLKDCHQGRRQRWSRGHYTSGVTISYPGAEIWKAVKVPSKDPVNCRLVPNWTSVALDKILWDKTTTMYNMALFGSEYLEYYVDVSNKKKSYHLFPFFSCPEAITTCGLVGHT